MKCLRSLEQFILFFLLLATTVYSAVGLLAIHRFEVSVSHFSVLPSLSSMLSVHKPPAFLSSLWILFTGPG